MKKLILIVLSFILMFSVGCSKSDSKLTMYVAHCKTTKLKQMPKESSLTLDTLELGKRVSFEKKYKNGYSKVVYRGETGYILTKHLSTENPKDMETDKSEDAEEKNPPSLQETPNPTKLTDEEIEKYVVNHVRPIFYGINNNPDDYISESSGKFTLLYTKDNRMVKKLCAKDADSSQFGREYYYDADTGKLVFAFIHNGTTEYRLYFYEDQLVRFIDSDSTLTNNPTSEFALEKAEFALSEAY